MMWIFRGGFSRYVLVTAGMALLGGLLVACDDDDANPAPTTVTVSPMATGTPSEATAQAIRLADFTSVEVIGALSDRAGAAGEVSPGRVHFEDLTGDGIEEAVVILESGGTLGDLGFGIYQVVGNEPGLAFFASAGGLVDVRSGAVVTQEGVYADGDAECCPSRLREISYGWNGNAFAQLSDQVVDNPAR